MAVLYSVGINSNHYQSYNTHTLAIQLISNYITKDATYMTSLIITVNFSLLNHKLIC